MINRILVISIISIFFINCSDSKSSVEEEVVEYLENDLVDQTDEMPADKKDTIKYLALGDSYTIGQNVTQEMRWPVQLLNRLENDSLIFSDQSPKIIARTGWTTAELQAAITDQQPTDDFDLVSLLIGVNNQYRGYDISIYKKEFESLLKQSIDFAQGDASKVFVVSIPDWGAMPFAEGRDREKIAKEIDEYNAINLSLSNQYKVTYFNITPISRRAANDNDLVASDGLHPSGEMYRLWVEDILPWARETLSN
ncbi:MAG: SGNH/GDSL hydrolase family protein [Cyclobacteriaceae bacterium]